MSGRLKGHPLHLLLIHFPSALYPFSATLDWLGFLARQESFAVSSYYCFLGAFAGGCLAAVFGAVDFFSLESKHPAWKTAALHGLLNVIWLCAFATLLGIRMKNNPGLIQDLPYLISYTVFTLGMFYSNFLGGELLLRYGVGQLPRKD